MTRKTVAWWICGCVAAMSVHFTREALAQRFDQAKPARVIANPGRMHMPLAVSPDGAVVVLSRDALVRILDLKSGKEIKTLEGHAKTVTNVAFSPDGKTVASGSRDRTIILWDRETWRERVRIKDGAGSVTGLAFSPDGKALASGSMDGAMHLWNPSDGTPIASVQAIDTPISLISFSADGQTLAAGGRVPVITLWDLRSRRSKVLNEGHTIVHEAVYSPDGRWLASCTNEADITLRDAKTEQVARTLTGSPGGAMCLAFSPDGNVLAAGGADYVVRLWDPRSGEALGNLRGHTDRILRIAFTPDGRTVISAAADGRVLFWNLE
jgi:WD40 repeat protein